MLENIREAFKERLEKTERSDIKFCKEYPTVWRWMMVTYAFVIGGIVIYAAIQDFTAILLVFAAIPSIYFIEKHMLTIYKKAFPKQS